LSHGYASAANFVIRHSALMLLLYVALIGSAGWLLATTPQGFIPAQDRGYVIVSAQLPGAASLARTTDVVREIERRALDTPGIVRGKAQKLGVPIANVTEAIQTYFGSTYVNDFNLFGRTYHVTAQADLPFRKETSDLARLRTRNAAGDMVQLGSVVEFKDISGPDRVARYNLYPASELQGDTLPGTSSATAINTMKR